MLSASLAGGEKQRRIFSSEDEKNASKAGAPSPPNLHKTCPISKESVKFDKSGAHK